MVCQSSLGETREQRLLIPSATFIELSHMAQQFMRLLQRLTPKELAQVSFD